MSDLDEFTRGYIETALWAETGAGMSENDPDNDRSFFDLGYSADDLSAESVSAIRAECEDFLTANSADVERYCEILGDWQGSDSVRGSDARYSALERAGGDFLLTRNGHGAGYWDRGLPADLGKRLTDASKAYGSTYLYLGDDGQVYAQ